MPIIFNNSPVLLLRYSTKNAIYIKSIHLFHSSENKDKQRVKLGEHNLYKNDNDWEQTMAFANVTIHHDYKFAWIFGKHDDIALVKLSHKAKLDNYVQIVNLADKGSNFTGQECVLAGWGLTGKGITKVLHEVCVVMLS